MKTIDFETGKRSRIYEHNTMVINEFFFAAMGCALVGYWASKAILTGYYDLYKTYDDIRKLKEANKKEREKAKEEKRQYREDKKLLNAEKDCYEKTSKQLKSMTKPLLLFQSTIDRLPKNERSEYNDQLDAMKRITQGNPTDDDIKMIEKDADREPSAEEKKAKEKIDNELNKISDEMIDSYIKKNDMSTDKLNDNMMKKVEASTDTNDKPEEPKKEPEEKIVDMEVEDPETGKKTKQKVHIGPQGGRYYWPQGSPHDSDHKVYVKK